MNKSICSVVNNYSKEEVKAFLERYGKCVDFLSNSTTSVENTIFIGSIVEVFGVKQKSSSPERCSSGSHRRYSTLVFSMDSWIKDKDVEHKYFRVLFIGEIVNQLLNAKVKEGNAIAVLKPHFFTALDIPSLSVGPNDATIWIFNDLKDEKTVNGQQDILSDNSNSECSKSTFASSLPRDHQVYRSRAINLKDICLNSDRNVDESISRNKSCLNRLKPVEEPRNQNNCIFSQNTAVAGSVNEPDHQKSFEFAIPVSSKHFQHSKRPLSNDSNCSSHNRISCNKHKFNCNRIQYCAKEEMSSCCRKISSCCREMSSCCREKSSCCREMSSCCRGMSCCPSFHRNCSCQPHSHTSSHCHSQAPIISCSHRCGNDSHISHFNDSIHCECLSDRRCCYIPGNDHNVRFTKQNHHCSGSPVKLCINTNNSKTSQCCNCRNCSKTQRCDNEQPPQSSRQHRSLNKECSFQSLEPASDGGVNQRIKQWVQEWTPKSPSPPLGPQYNMPSTSHSKEIQKKNKKKTNECPALPLENDRNNEPLCNSTPISNSHKRRNGGSCVLNIAELEKLCKIKRKKRKLFNYLDVTSIIEEKSNATNEIIDESTPMTPSDSGENKGSIHDSSMTVNFEHESNQVNENDEENIENCDEPIVSDNKSIGNISIEDDVVNIKEMITGKGSSCKDSEKVVDMEIGESVKGNENDTNEIIIVDGKQTFSEGSFPPLTLESVSNDNEPQDQNDVSSDTNADKENMQYNTQAETTVNESSNLNILNSSLTSSEDNKSNPNTLLSLSLSDYCKVNEVSDAITGDQEIIPAKDCGSNDSLHGERLNQSDSEEPMELVSESTINKRQRRKSLTKSLSKVQSDHFDSFESDKSNETVHRDKENIIGSQSAVSSTGTFCDALSDVHGSQKSKTHSSESWCKKLIEDVFDENVSKAYSKLLPRSQNEAVVPKLYDTCNVSGVIIDIVPDIKADRFSIIQGFCHEGCRKVYKFDEFSCMEEMDHTCSACKYRFHYGCPGCKSKGLQNSICVFFSFEIHLLDGNNVWRIEVEHADAVQFLGSTPTLYIKSDAKLSKKLIKLIVPAPPFDFVGSAIVLKGTVKAKMKLGSLILTFHNTTLKTSLYLNGSHYKYTCSK